jgi:hypothetical protein
MSTTDLQHPFAGEVYLCGRAVVKLNGIAIRLVGCRERHVHRRVFFVAVVQEYHIVAVKPAGRVAVNESLNALRKLLVQIEQESVSGLEYLISEDHGRSMPEIGVSRAAFAGAEPFDDVVRTRYAKVVDT